MTFNIKTKEEIINEILIQIVENVDAITDVNVGATLRTLVESLGLELEDIYTELENVYTGTRIDEATGDDLDNLGALVGITRKQGTKAQNYVTFKRNIPTGSSFIIPQGAIVSTQPNTSEEQLQFLVINNTTFNPSITNESHKFVNGIYNYKLEERFIDSITELTGLVSSAPFTFTENTDFIIVNNYNDLVIDTDTVTIVDNCDATTDWNTGIGAIAIALDTVDFKQGTGSLMLGKSTTATNSVYYDKVLGSVFDSSDKKAYFWFKILDITTLNKLNNIKVTFGNSSISNSNSYVFTNSKLKVGWNIYELDFSDSTIIKQGIPNGYVYNYVRYTIETNNDSDVLASGDLKLDFIILAEGEQYKGDIVQFLATGTLPDTNSNIAVDYIPLSKEVLCESQNVGEKYNVVKEKIFFKVSFISNIDSVNNYVAMSSGTDIEVDDDLRDRIKSATELKGKATVESLKQAVLGVEGITSVSVDDMPLKSASTEPHLFVDFATTDTQKLDYEVVQNDVNLVVSGTRGSLPVTFVNGVDYFLENSTINWVSSGTCPDNGTTFLVDYDYRWLGHVNMFVSGATTPLPSYVITNVDNAIYDTRSAGIDVQWYEPTVVTVNISASILIDTANGYLFPNVKIDVEDAITELLNNKETGEILYISEIIEVIMKTAGVKNTTVSLPASDVTVAIDEIVKVGTITITQI